MKADTGYNEITGITKIIFPEKARSTIVDIKVTFDQVSALNTPSGEMYRLYSSTFKRIPDPNSLKYWIDVDWPGINKITVLAALFV